MGRRTDQVFGGLLAIGSGEMCWYDLYFILALLSLFIFVPLGILVAFIFDSISIFVAISHSLVLSCTVFLSFSIKCLYEELYKEYFDKNRIYVRNRLKGNQNKHIYIIKKNKKAIAYSILAIICIVVIETSIFFY